MASGKRAQFGVIVGPDRVALSPQFVWLSGGRRVEVADPNAAVPERFRDMDAAPGGGVIVVFIGAAPAQQGERQSRQISVPGLYEPVAVVPIGAEQGRRLDAGEWPARQVQTERVSLVTE